MRTIKLKVYIKGHAGQIYRTFSMNDQTRLDDLASAILDSFDFDRDHLYEFCMTGRFYSEDNYQLNPESSTRSTRTRLEKLDLKKGQNFLFHYDFGDDWVFTIHVMSTEPVYSRKGVVLLAQKGELEQYPNAENDDFCPFEEYDFKNKELAQTLESSLRETGHFEEEYENSFDLIRLADSLEPGSVDYENCEGHLLLVPGNVFHQGIAMYEEDGRYHVAMYFTPWDFGMESKFGIQMFNEIGYIDDINGARMYILANIADKKVDHQHQLDVLMPYGHILRLHGNDFMSSFPAFSQKAKQEARTQRISDELVDEMLKGYHQLWM